MDSSLFEGCSMVLLKAILSAAVLLGQAVSPERLEPTTARHAAITLETKVQIHGGHGNAFRSLMETGLSNHIPMGVVIGKDQSICKDVLGTELKTGTVAELIDEIEHDIPGYRAELRQGVLNVEPYTLTASGQRFLTYRLRKFHSGPESMVMMSFNLWMWYRAEIVPEEGQAFAGAISSTADTDLEMRNPYEVYGYVGNEAVIQMSLGCGEK
jgi:hypothetical protein